jgi:hypothetical protein
MIVKTSYRDGSAGYLTQYIGRDGHQLRDRAGRELSNDEVRHFVGESERYGHEREFILSPEEGEELSLQEFDTATRRTMREWSRETAGETARYVYATHEDSEHKHAHVAVTGTRSDLFTDSDDLADLREHGREHYREREREQERVREREPEREREQEQEQEQQSDRAVGR